MTFVINEDVGNMGLILAALWPIMFYIVRFFLNDDITSAHMKYQQTYTLLIHVICLWIYSTL